MKLKFITILLFMLSLAFSIAFSQNIDEKDNDDPYARIEYERRMLADPITGKIPENIRAKELKFAKTLPTIESRIKALKKNNSSTSNNNEQSLDWVSRGPRNVGGRTRALAVDVRTDNENDIANNSVILIAGGVSGGIYKSIDNGETWVNKLAPELIHSVNCITQDTRVGYENNWYIGTGEEIGNSASGNWGEAPFKGNGILKSTDNGETWSLKKLSDSFISNIAVNKLTGSIFAASNGVILKSSDGGENWSENLGTYLEGYVDLTDIQINSLGALYAVNSYSNKGFYYAVRSTDDGKNWTKIAPSNFPYGSRALIAISPSNENIIYFLIDKSSDNNNPDVRLWKYIFKSGDGTGTGGEWKDLSDNLPRSSLLVNGISNPNFNFNSYKGYAMVLKVKPDDPNFVIIGGTNLYKSVDGFSSSIPYDGWIGGYKKSRLTQDNSVYLNHHPDQHSIVFLSSNPLIVYSGHDGGISITNNITSSSVSWTNLNNGYETSQFYSLAVVPKISGDETLIGGLQDNGNYYTLTNNNSEWFDWGFGGDGGYAAISNKSTYYMESQNGRLFRLNINSTGDIIDHYLVSEGADNYLFINPFVLDPNNILYYAEHDVVARNDNATGSS